MEEDIQHFGILCFIISRKVKMQLKCIKRFIQCMEKVLWLIEHVRRGLQSFMLGISCWTIAPRLGRPVEVDSNEIQTLMKNNQSYTMQEVANILKISKSVKLLVKMKNCVSYFIENNIRIFGQPNIAFFQLLVLNYLFLLLNVLIFVLYILELLLGA